MGTTGFMSISSGMVRESHGCTVTVEDYCADQVFLHFTTTRHHVEVTLAGAHLALLRGMIDDALARQRAVADEAVAVQMAAAAS